MEIVKVKGQKWDILDKLSDDVYKVQRKKKIGILKKFDSKSDAFSNFLENYKRLKIASVRMGKVFAIDKKQKIVIFEFLDGEIVFDTLLKHDLDDLYFGEIFEQEWLARYEKITLNLYPDNWMLVNKKLYYLPFVYYDGVDEEKTFEKYYIRFWFFTKDFIKYAKEKGIDVDTSRLKQEYELNKEMVLVSIKHHII